jgi:hypothetical protein
MLASSKRKLRQVLLIVIPIHYMIQEGAGPDYSFLLCLAQSILSPWERLFHHGDCSSFFLMTGFSQNVFN